ncbi:binding-protein-dependent transport system inner membrane protein [Caballeronia sordidicola]|uniref:Binding-protein-dependent transport system inner membrane protein n=1 Tax=Caballeronia sordidicola TaxID=196367 RepID=A0A158I6T3_CABSO|nr:ABC transporter permease [Caballeronia sordidicola]SAL52315.1 binding-protein-dependent transport system inner membrane protein [Caballeronia sordidicola]
MAVIVPLPSAAPPRASSRLHTAGRRLLRRPASVAAGVVIVLFVATAIFAPWLAPLDPLHSDFLMVRQAPSALHWLGTDEVGRDVLSRLIWGTRASLLAGIVPVLVACGISVPLGVISGYAGGWIDALVMRVTDAMLAVPFLIVAIAMAAFLGPDLRNSILAIGVAALPAFLRLARAAAMTIRTEDYVDAARVVGATPLRIVFRHVLPNMLPPLLVQASITAAAAVIAEASLSFLGLGQQPPAPSWGSMLNAAQQYMVDAPWMAIAPGAMIFVLVISLNVFGDCVRDALDTRRR